VTLIELLVAMVISLVLALAVLMVQRSLTMQKTRSADVGLRDNEARAALDLMARDASSAGFLFGGSHLPCDAVYTYNAASGHYKRLPVDAIAAASGKTMPFAPGLKLNYPPAGNATPSDVLVLTGAVDSSNFSSAKSPSVPVLNLPASYSPLNTGRLPVRGTTGLTTGHVGVVNVVDRDKRACMRVPFTAVAVVAGVAEISSSGNLMPGTYYAGFGAQMLAPTFAGPLADAQILVGGSVVDLGDPAAGPARHTTTAFYIDNNNGSWPMLMRASYSLLNDTVVAGSPQPVAAGVVSLQVLFGVDPGLTGQVTDYMTGAQVKAAGIQQVRSVRIAMLNRTLFEDPDLKTPAPNPYPIPQSLLPGQSAKFTSVPYPAGFEKYRFSLHQVEVAVRNCLWTTCNP
jgi:type IV pilus assembly protein PilW